MAISFEGARQFLRNVFTERQPRTPLCNLTQTAIQTGCVKYPGAYGYPKSLTECPHCPKMISQLELLRKQDEVYRDDIRGV